MEFDEDYLSCLNSFTSCFICLQSVPFNMNSEEQINLTNLFFKYLQIEDKIEASFVCERCCDKLKKFVELCSKSAISEKTRLEIDYILGYVKSAILSSKNSNPDDGVGRELVAKKCAEKMQKRQAQLILERIDILKIVKVEGSQTPMSDNADWFQDIDPSHSPSASPPDMKPEIASENFQSPEQFKIRVINLQRRIKAVDGGLTLYKCDFCNKKFANHSNLKIHIAAIHKKQNSKVCCQVPGCDKSYSKMHGLKAHYKVSHPDCKVPSRRRISRVQNKFTVFTDETGENVFECKLCPKKLKSRMAISQHVRIVHEPKTLLCSKCGYKANHKSRMERHKVMHRSGNEPKSDGMKVKCPTCSKIFSRYALKQHIDNVHLRLKPYLCDICAKSFATLAHLKEHKRIVHLRLKPYKCDLCDKSFPTPFRLRAHKATPHNPTSSSSFTMFPCKICGKAFGHPSSLWKHEKSIHTQKRFSCHICKKEFKQRYNLKGHLEVHEKRRHYCKAEGCNRSYSLSATLVRHYKIFHPDFAIPVNISISSTS